MAFFATANTHGYTFDVFPNYFQWARITGTYTNTHGSIPSTAMIIRFGACKYGLDELAFAADAWEESWWRQATAGDLSSSCSQGSFNTCSTAITLADGNVVPLHAGQGYQSWSLYQTKAYYEYPTWESISNKTLEDSTVFATEYQDATMRACMNNAYAAYMGGTSYATDFANYQANPNGMDPSWADWDNYPANVDPAFAKTYANRMMWGCLGTHFTGFGSWITQTPAATYIANVQGNEVCRRWLTPNVDVTGPCL